MEGERKLKIVLIVLATVVFALSYVVGYIVGKEAGFREAQKKFEVERQRLLKTLAQLNPVSRPIENRVLEEKSKSVEEVEKEKSSGESVSEEHGVNEEKGEVEEEEAQKVEEVKKEEEKDLSSSVVEKKKEIRSEQQNAKNEKSGGEVQSVEEGNYYLQVGVFRNRANALKFAERLRDLGFKVKTVFKKNLTIVIVGYYETLQEAKAVKEELAKEKINSIIKRRKG